jgi:hypothetical protein
LGLKFRRHTFGEGKPIEQRTSEWEKRRSMKMEYQRFQKKNSELDECTFSPNTTPSKSRPATSPSTSVNGYEEYVEKQAEIRKKLQDDKLHAQKVFSTGGSWRNKTTVPKEFKLGTKRNISVKALERVNNMLKVLTIIACKYPLDQLHQCFSMFASFSN